MTEYEQWLENKAKYGEFETEEQFWENQEDKPCKQLPDCPF